MSRLYIFIIYIFFGITVSCQAMTEQNKDQHKHKLEEKISNLSDIFKQEYDNLQNMIRVSFEVPKIEELIKNFENQFLAKKALFEKELNSLTNQETIPSTKTL